ncbi:MAG TPA: hypothetical protein VEG44_10355 [Candidatus Acidoferrales bacterium]|nr:hypothetical protein [Candidatus Acidoferrales bacterium]
MRRSKNKAYIYVPMAIVLDEQFPFRSKENSEMIEVELCIRDGTLVVRQIEPRITDDVHLLYE